MRIVRTKNLASGQKQEIFELWNNEYPQNFEYHNISELDEHFSKLEDQNHILLIDEHDKIKGWYSDFIRDNERWFLAILNSDIQGRNWEQRLSKRPKKPMKN